MKLTPSQRSERSHKRREEAGWRRMTLRLPPEAAEALAWLEEATGHNPTKIIADVLVLKASMARKRIERDQGV